LLPARQRRSALGYERIESLRKLRDEVMELGCVYCLGEALISDMVAEGDVLTEREIEEHAILEDEPYLRVELMLSVFVQSISVVFDDTRGRLEKPRHEVEELRLPGSGRPDDRVLRSGPD